MAQTIARQQLIVQLRLVEHLTWAAIGKKLGAGKKECRESYLLYQEEIAPLLLAVPAAGKAAELLAVYDDVRQRLLQVADRGTNDSAEVGALRTVLTATTLEANLRRALGLLPPLLRDQELRVIGREIVAVLMQHGVSEQVISEIAALLAGSDNEEETS